MSLTSDPTDPRLGHGSNDEPVPQNEGYLVLSDEERAKGFVRPVRTKLGSTGEEGSMSDPRCVVSSRHTDPAKTPRALDGLYVCRGHRLKVERMIAELPALYDDLGSALTSSETHDNDSGRRKNSAKGAGVNLNGNVVEARDEMHAELVRLVRYVTEERGLTGPSVDRVSALASWLTAHVDWLCAQPDADETHDFLDGLTKACFSLAFPSGRRRFVIPDVACDAPLWCDVDTKEITRCPGNLVALLTPQDALELPSEIICDTCGVEIPSTRWYRWAEERKAS